MRKVIVEVKVKLVINTTEDVSMGNVVNEADYSFVDTTGLATIEDAEILDYEVKDSR